MFTKFGPPRAFPPLRELLGTPRPQISPYISTRSYQTKKRRPTRAVEHLNKADYGEHNELAEAIRSFQPRQEFPSARLTMTDFKAHHMRAITKLVQMTGQIDVVLEIRDARIPISGRNLLLDRVLTGKKKIIIYTKKDLSTLKVSDLERWHGQGSEGRSFVLVDCTNPRDIQKILRALKMAYEEMYPAPPLGLRALVTGVPNAGKSTLLNELRHLGLKSSGKKKVARTGNMPGVTRSLSEMIRVSRTPSILVNDTPGVAVPIVSDEETMIKLALTGAASFHTVDPVIQADYLLFHLNKIYGDHRAYKEYHSKPTNNIETFLRTLISRKFGSDAKAPLYSRLVGAATWWVDRWRRGMEYRVCLDDLTLSREDYEASEKQEYERCMQLRQGLNVEMAKAAAARSRQLSKL